MLTRWRAVRMGHRDAGMTLAEVVVGMTLLSIVGALALNFFVGSAQQADRVGDQSQGGAELRVASEHIATELRLADTPTARPGFVAGRFERLDPNRIVFYANLNPASRAGTNGRTPPTRIDISVVGDQLVEKTYAPIVAYAAAASPTPTPAPTPYPSPYDYNANYPAHSDTDATNDKPTSRAVLLNGLANATTLPPTPVFSYCSASTDPAATCTAATDAGNVASVAITLLVKGNAGGVTQTMQTTVAITGAVS